MWVCSGNRLGRAEEVQLPALTRSPTTPQGLQSKWVRSNQKSNHTTVSTINPEVQPHHQAYSPSEYDQTRSPTTPPGLQSKWVRSNQKSNHTTGLTVRVSTIKPEVQPHHRAYSPSEYDQTRSPTTPQDLQSEWVRSNQKSNHTTGLTVRSKWVQSNGGKPHQCLDGWFHTEASLWQTRWPFPESEGKRERNKMVEEKGVGGGVGGGSAFDNYFWMCDCPSANKKKEEEKNVMDVYILTSTWHKQSENWITADFFSAKHFAGLTEHNRGKATNGK